MNTWCKQPHWTEWYTEHAAFGSLSSIRADFYLLGNNLLSLVRGEAKAFLPHLQNPLDGPQTVYLQQSLSAKLTDLLWSVAIHNVRHHGYLPIQQRRQLQRDLVGHHHCDVHSWRIFLNGLPAREASVRHFAKPSHAFMDSAHKAANCFRNIRSSKPNTLISHPGSCNSVNWHL